MNKKTFIVAVSGGIDSVVMLHMIKKHHDTLVDKNSIKYVVAHFDHGIRIDSEDDRKFVENLAKNYDMEFETERVKLGASVSEDTARTLRYEFLHKLLKKYNAEAIVVAHHQDDVLETMVLNIIRGTGPRGLIGFTQNNILRPLISKTKKEIKDYAQKNNLEWREDSTNEDLKYLRNYVRKNIIPMINSKRSELLNIRSYVVDNYREIDDLINKLSSYLLKDNEILRRRFVILPYSVQKEYMAFVLRNNHIELDNKMVELCTLSAKTLTPGKHIEISKNAKLFIHKETVVVKSS